MASDTGHDFGGVSPRMTARAIAVAAATKSPMPPKAQPIMKIQRKPAIGCNKAARIVEMMEEQGAVSRASHVGRREAPAPER